MYYVIQVKIGNEQKVIGKINNLEGKIHDYEAFVPCRKTLRKYKGQFKPVIERCFPGYVFVETNHPKELFFDLSKIEEFTRLLGREGLTYNFNPLDENESRTVDILYGKKTHRVTDISTIELIEGDQIRILAGPLKDIDGRIVKKKLHKRKVTVEIILMNRSVEVDVGIDIIAKSKQTSI